MKQHQFLKIWRDLFFEVYMFALDYMVSIYILSIYFSVQEFNTNIHCLCIWAVGQVQVKIFQDCFNYTFKVYLPFSILSLILHFHFFYEFLFPVLIFPLGFEYSPLLLYFFLLALPFMSSAFLINVAKLPFLFSAIFEIPTRLKSTWDFYRNFFFSYFRFRNHFFSLKF